MKGRFAPSPTGPLHIGSLLAAVASYCESKKQGGQWLLRIEDVDQTRTVQGATIEILRTLTRYGFVWDEEVLMQSQRVDLYAQALQQLKALGLVYPCTCSRKEIADSSHLTGIEGLIYPGTCRLHPAKTNARSAWRMQVGQATICFADKIQGEICHHMATDIGDFVLQRADGLFSYQLAVVVDDALQGVTQIVRGADLLNSTTRQILLQQVLGYPTPSYAHLPVVLNAQGQKLSKQTLAAALPHDNILPVLWAVWALLGQTMPDQPSRFTLGDFWDWAMAHWQLTKVSAQSRTVSTLASC